MHGYEIGSQLGYKQYNAIIVCSGDGLLFELVNGLMNREDWSELKDIITLGVIPGGTGNGLIKSLLNENNEQYGIKEAAWLIIKG